MTRDEILAMEAGPELNALVAEHVMGWTWGKYWRWPDWTPWPGCPDRVLYPPEGYERPPARALGSEIASIGWYERPPGWSEHMDPAWEVAQWLIENAFPFELAWYKRETKCRWWCYTGKYAPGNIAPLAICRAALLAVMEVDA